MIKCKLTSCSLLEIELVLAWGRGTQSALRLWAGPAGVCHSSVLQRCAGVLCAVMSDELLGGNIRPGSRRALLDLCPWAENFESSP